MGSPFSPLFLSLLWLFLPSKLLFWGGKTSVSEVERVLDMLRAVRLNFPLWSWGGDRKHHSQTRLRGGSDLLPPSLPARPDVGYHHREHGYRRVTELFSLLHHLQGVVMPGQALREGRFSFPGQGWVSPCVPSALGIPVLEQILSPGGGHPHVFAWMRGRLDEGIAALPYGL